MANSLDSLIGLRISAHLQSALDIGAAKYDVEIGPTTVLADGTGANQARKIFTDIRTLTASSSENIDLDSALTDAFGATLSFTKVKAICILADSANVNDVIIGNHATAAFVGPFGAAANTIAVSPGGMFLITRPDATGWAVTGTTADMIKVLNGGAGTSVTYTIILIGV